MTKLCRYALNTVATTAIALSATRWFVRLPIETPLPSLIQAALDGLGIDVVAHADAIEPIGLLIVLLAGLAIGAGVVWAVHRVLRPRGRARMP